MARAKIVYPRSAAVLSRSGSECEGTKGCWSSRSAVSGLLRLRTVALRYPAGRLHRYILRALVHPGQTGFDGIDARGLPVEGGQQLPVTDAAGHQKRQREPNAQEPGEVTHRRGPSVFRPPSSVFRDLPSGFGFRVSDFRPRPLPSDFRPPTSGFGLRPLDFSHQPLDFRLRSHITLYRSTKPVTLVTAPPFSEISSFCLLRSAFASQTTPGGGS